MMTLTEKRFFEWHEDDRSVSLRAKSGSYGGGSEVLVIQRRFTSVNLKNTEVCPTLEAGGAKEGITCR